MSRSLTKVLIKCNVTKGKVIYFTYRIIDLRQFNSKTSHRLLNTTFTDRNVYSNQK